MLNSNKHSKPLDWRIGASNVIDSEVGFDEFNPPPPAPQPFLRRSSLPGQKMTQKRVTVTAVADTGPGAHRLWEGHPPQATHFKAPVFAAGTSKVTRTP